MCCFFVNKGMWWGSKFMCGFFVNKETGNATTFVDEQTRKGATIIVDGRGTNHCPSHNIISTFWLLGYKIKGAGRKVLMYLSKTFCVHLALTLKRTKTTF